MNTIRAHLEAILDAHNQDGPIAWFCYRCGDLADTGECMEHKHAVAALAILDDAERCGTGIQTTKTLDELTQCRLIPDPRIEAS